MDSPRPSRGDTDEKDSEHQRGKQRRGTNPDAGQQQQPQPDLGERKHSGERRDRRLGQQLVGAHRDDRLQRINSLEPARGQPDRGQSEAGEHAQPSGRCHECHRKVPPGQGSLSFGYNPSDER